MFEYLVKSSYTLFVFGHSYFFCTDHPEQFIWNFLPSSIQIIQNNSFGNSYPLLYRSSRTIYLETLTLFYTDHPGQFIWKLLPSSIRSFRTIHLETLTLFYKIIQNNSFGNSNPSIQIIQDNSFGNSNPLLYRSFRTIHLETLTSSVQIIQDNLFGKSYLF